MATNVHSQLTGDEIHTPYIKTFATELARTGDSSTYTTADLYKKALQIDTGVEYILTAVTPVWTAVADASSIVISDGGTIGGTYQSSVLCLGDVTMNDDVDVKGNLIVNGAFENADGYELIVYGDLGVRNSMNFNRTDITLPQSDITVWGNMVCKRILFRQSGNDPKELFVNGNLTSESDFGINMSGEDDTGCTAGGILTVGGDFKAYSIDVSGGINVAGTAKNGGTISVNGDFNIVDTIDASGGEGGSFRGGDAGSVTGSGSLTCSTINCNGGSSTSANAGNGGNITVGGDVVIGVCNSVGGDCSSDDGSHSAGVGGSISVNGNIVCTGLVLNGGNRTGTIVTPGSGTAPNAGSLNCFGNMVARYIRLVGGVADADVLTSTGGGGGIADIRGNLILRGPLFSSINGGNSAKGDGGAGGNLTVEGFCRLEEFTAIGGAAADVAKTNGSGGSLYFFSGVSCEVSLDMNDGVGVGLASTGDVRLALAGHCSFGSVGITDRSNAWIYAPNNPATLQVNLMPLKQTLNENDGTVTGNINSMLADSTFITCGGLGTWYRVQGTAV